MCLSIGISDFSAVILSVSLSPYSFPYLYLSIYQPPFIYSSWSVKLSHQKKNKTQIIMLENKNRKMLELAFDESATDKRMH